MTATGESVRRQASTRRGDRSICPCGTPVEFDSIDGWQHADGSVSHDGEFHGKSVSDLMRTAVWAKPDDGMTRMHPRDLMPHVGDFDLDHNLVDSMREHGWNPEKGKQFLRQRGQPHEDENPVTLWHTDQGSYVEPGNHRVPAADAAGLDSIPVLVKDRRTKPPVTARFTPDQRVFTHTDGLDHRLFDGEHLRPEVRSYVLGTITTWWAGEYQGWSRWARVYFAGSEASEWSSPTLEGNADFDVLIGVDYDGCRAANPQLGGLSNQQITDRMNSGFRAHNSDHVWLPIRLGSSTWPLSSNSISNGPFGAIARGSARQPSAVRPGSPPQRSAGRSTSPVSPETQLGRKGNERSRPERNASFAVPPLSSQPTHTRAEFGWRDASLAAGSMSATITSCEGTGSQSSSTTPSSPARVVAVRSAGMQSDSTSITITGAARASTPAESAFGASSAHDTTGPLAGSETKTSTPLFVISLNGPSQSLPDGWVWTGPWSRTTFCNVDSHDIRRIRPYAAYEVGADVWVVKPPHLPHWSLSELPKPVQQVLRAADSYARHVLKLPEPERTQQGAALFEAWHSDRSRAFSDRGEGWWDVANLREKWGSMAGWWDELVACKRRADQGLDRAPEDWSNVPTGYTATAATDKWPPYLTEREDGQGDSHPVNVSRSDPRGPVGTEEDAKAAGLVGPFFHGTTKRRARDIRHNGFRQPRVHNWDMASAGTAEEVDMGHTHRTFFAEKHEDAHRFAQANHGDQVDVVKAYLHPDHIERDSGGGWMPSVQVRDVAHAMAISDRSRRRTASAGSSDHQQGYEHGLLGARGNLPYIERTRARGRELDPEDHDYLAGHAAGTQEKQRRDQHRAETGDYKCPQCSGTGMGVWRNGSQCNECQGSGSISQEAAHKTDTLYHVTDNPHFTPNAHHIPEDNTVAIENRSRPGLYAAHKDGVEHWTQGEGYVRPYVAEIHVPHHAHEPGRWGGERFIPAEHFDKVKVGRVIPLSAHGTNYRGPDARDMTPEQHAVHKQHALDTLRDEHDFGPEDIDHLRRAWAAATSPMLDHLFCTEGTPAHHVAVAGEPGELQPHQAAVYRAQSAMTNSGKNLYHYLNHGHAQDMCRAVLTEQGHPHGDKVLITHSNPGKSYVKYDSDNGWPRIGLAPNHLHSHAVFHELAHVLTNGDHESGSDEEAHGPAFVHTYRHLLDSYDSSAARQVFDEHYRPPGEGHVASYQHRPAGPPRPDDYYEGGQPAHDLNQGRSGDAYGDGTVPGSRFKVRTLQDKADAPTQDVLRKAKGNPEHPVTMYRALPHEHVAGGIHTGDWVTLSKSYAQAHARGNGGWPVIKATVPAKHLWTDGDYNEWGYHGPDVEGEIHTQGRHASTGTTLYHWAPKAARDDIAEHGLDHRRAPGFSEAHPGPHGVFMHHSEALARDWAPDIERTHDLYEVRVSGLKLHPDPYDTGDASYTEHPVPPDRLRRIAARSTQVWITPQLVMGSAAGLNHARAVHSVSEAQSVISEGLTAVLPAGSWFIARQALQALGMSLLDVTQRLRQLGAPVSVTGQQVSATADPAVQQAQRLTRNVNPALQRPFADESEASGVLQRVLHHLGHPRADEAFVIRHERPEQNRSQVVYDDATGAPGVALHPDRWDRSGLAHEVGHLMHIHSGDVDHSGPVDDSLMHGREFQEHHRRALESLDPKAGRDYGRILGLR